MTLEDLLDLTTNRLANSTQRRTVAVAVGDVSLIAALDVEIAQTEATRAQLLTLLPS